MYDKFYEFSHFGCWIKAQQHYHANDHGVLVDTKLSTFEYRKNEINNCNHDLYAVIENTEETNWKLFAACVTLVLLCNRKISSLIVTCKWTIRLVMLRLNFEYVNIVFAFISLLWIVFYMKIEKSKAFLVLPFTLRNLIVIQISPGYWPVPIKQRTRTKRQSKQLN